MNGPVAESRALAQALFALRLAGDARHGPLPWTQLVVREHEHAIAVADTLAELTTAAREQEERACRVVLDHVMARAR